MQFFADRIFRVMVNGSIVKIELGSAHLPAEQGKQMTLAVTDTLVMPLDGFANAVDTFVKLRDQMIADGTIRQVPKAGDVGQVKRT